MRIDKRVGFGVVAFAQDRHREFARVLRVKLSAFAVPLDHHYTAAGAVRNDGMRMDDVRIADPLAGLEKRRVHRAPASRSMRSRAAALKISTKTACTGGPTNASNNSPRPQARATTRTVSSGIAAILRRASARRLS